MIIICIWFLMFTAQIFLLVYGVITQSSACTLVSSIIGIAYFLIITLCKEDKLMIIDYELAKECKNEDAWCVCRKCGKCGRKFEDGFMVDAGGTTVLEEE